MMKIPDFKLERYFAKYEFAVDHVLCGSDCESMTVADLLALEEGAEESFKGQWLGYTESLGSPSLRQEIASLYQEVGSENILVHTGAEEAIFLFMHAVLEAGDHVVVQWPCYQSLAEVARSIGCRVSLWEVREEAGWEPDMDELRTMLRPETRALVVNSPHNPTGGLLPRETFDRITALADAKGFLLFSDEVCRGTEYDPVLQLPAACDVTPNGVSLGVMSKTYGLPGLRIGWVATSNQDVLSRMASLKDYTTICNSAPSEFLAEVALRNSAKIVKRNLNLTLRNLKLVEDLFSRYGHRISWTRPKATSIAFPRLLAGDVEEFCHRLVTQEGVLLLPGTLYDHPGNHFRIGFGRKNLEEALVRLERFLEAEG
jgi:aspartate/methionine/tyrosine aminotransferase